MGRVKSPWRDRPDQGLGLRGITATGTRWRPVLSEWEGTIGAVGGRAGIRARSARVPSPVVRRIDEDPEWVSLATPIGRGPFGGIAAADSVSEMRGAADA